MNTQRESAVLQCYQPRLVPLEPNLVAAVFPLMKIYPAEFCVRQAEEQGSVRAQSLIVESSSGNLAMGLAIVCRLRGYPLVIVSDHACDPALRRRLEDLGTRVEIVGAPASSGGYQRARLDRLDEIRDRAPDHFWVNQYDNPCNPGAYSPFASQLVEELGHIDCLVGSVGSGGSMCGTARFLRELFPEMVAIGVDTHASVLFGQPDGPRPLRGLGNSLLPKNLDHQVFDEVHWLTCAEAYLATRELHRRTALFCGGTSGAAWMVAADWARRHPRARVVCIFPDDGFRYTETIYNDAHLVEHGLLLDTLPDGPREVASPADAGPGWSCMRWGRRTYAEVMGQAPAAMAAVRA